MEMSGMILSYALLSAIGSLATDCTTNKEFKRWDWHVFSPNDYKVTTGLNSDTYVSILLLEGLWGPPDNSIYAERMDNHRVRDFVLKKQLLCMLALVNKGELFNPLFPQVGEPGIRGPFPAPL